MHGAQISVTFHSTPEVFSCKNRSPGLASSYYGRLPILKDSDFCPFVSFTVTGIARKFHPIPSALSKPAHKRLIARYSTMLHSITAIVYLSITKCVILNMQ